MPIFRATKGALLKFLEMPLDVIYMIMESLKARDLLNLARTDRRFRTILMDRNKGSPIWRSTIANVEGLPPCPPYMAEPAYINLMFFSNCHECLRNGVATIIFGWGVRYCNSCRSSRTIPMKDERAFLYQIRQATGVEEPFYSWKGRFHKSEVERFREQWDALLEDDEGRRALATSSQSHVNTRRKHTVACQAWLEFLKSLRKAQNDSIKSCRLTGIKQRLLDAGYDMALKIVSEDELAKQPFAAKGARLTNRSWENIKADAIEFVVGHWEKHVRQEKAQLLHPRLAEFFDRFPEWLKHSGWVPNAYTLELIAQLQPADFLLMPEISTHVYAPVEYYVHNLSPFLGVLDFLVQMWYDKQRNSLTELIRASVPELSTHRNPLSLAISCFSCAKPTCSKTAMHYPAVLNHRCWNKAWDISDRNTSYHSIVVEYLQKHGETYPWEIDSVRVHPWMIDRIRAIVRACGLDPLTASQSAVVSGKRMTCEDCRVDAAYGYEVFDFHRAIHHEATHKHEGRPCTWVVLPEETARLVRECEERARAESRRRYYLRKSYCCRIQDSESSRCCCYATCDFQDLMVHMRAIHDVQDELDSSKDHWVSYVTEENNHILHGTFIRYTSSGEARVLFKDLHVV